MILEHDLQNIVVWSLFASSLVQGVLHMVTFFVLLRQDSETDIGKALAWREMSLGFKALSRSLIDMMLVWLVVFDHMLIGNTNSRMIIYTMVSLSTYLSFVIGINYIIRLKTENWGKSDYQIRIDEIQSRRDRRERKDRRTKGDRPGPA
jgi:hypothetical protein